MKQRITALLVATALAAPTGLAIAQDDDRGLIQRTLEDSLSAEGRTVRVIGFEGALSAQASLDELTVADENGVWLTLRDATLDWQRTALLRGRVEVNELKAAEIILDRLPEPVSGAPDAEASGFSLPDLPVAINIGALTADRIEISSEVLGQDATFSLDGAMQLEGGEGEVQLEALRTDRGNDAFTISGSFANATEMLVLNLLLEENADGIVSNLLGLPGAPSLRLATKGEGPLSDFAASLELATDGEDRLTGAFSLTEIDAVQTFGADVRGDIAPLFAPDYQAFFGNDIALTLNGRSLPEGGTEIPAFTLNAAAIDLSGALIIGADGLPLEIDIDGLIAAPDGTPVLLPTGGTPTEVERAELTVSFDAAAGDSWTGETIVTGLSQPGFSAEAATLSATGQITRDRAPGVTADLTFLAEALDLSDASAEAALGEEVSGEVTIAWQQDTPITLSDLRVAGETYDLTGNAQIEALDGAIDITTDLAAAARDLSVFSGIAGRSLGGAITADVAGTLSPIAGTFNIALAGETLDITVDQAEANRLLAGTATLEATLRRTTAGTFLDALRIDGDAAQIRASAQLAGDDSRATADLTLIDTGVIAEDLDGPAQLNVTAVQTGPVWDIDGTLNAPDVDATFDVAADLSGDIPAISGDVTATAATLAPFSARAGRPLAGGIDLTLAGSLTADLSAFDVTADFTGQDLRISQPEADRLLAGTATVQAIARRTAEGTFVDTLNIDGDAARIRASGQLVGEDGAITADATLFDTGVIAEDVAGPARLIFTADQTGTVWDIDGTLSAPDVNATVDATADLGPDIPEIAGEITASAASLAPFSERAGRALSGGIDLSLAGSLTTDFEIFDLAGEVTGQDLRISQPDADRLLAGTARVTAEIARDGNSVDVTTLSIDAPEVSLTASGDLAEESGTLTIAARLANIAPYAPGFSGPATVDGTLGRITDGDWQIDLTGTGPGNIRIATEGTLAENLSTANVTLNGAAPLSLANRFISPRTVSGSLGFDLALNGPPGLQALSGRLETANARASSPNERIVLSDLDTTVTLSNGRAKLDVRAQAEAGGQITVQGPITLSDPFNGTLAIALNRLNIRDPSLYQTTVDGTVRIDGPLAGGASINGQIRLDETNVQIPSGSISGAGSIPNITHLNEPAAVRLTRQRAGLIASDSGNGTGGTSGPAYPLDVSVTAANRIFIRGRGLEAELGGALRLRGTTDDIIPDGQFNLIRGRLDILGQRLVLTEGRATLEGDFDPTLFFVAETDADDVTVRIIVEGQASEPRIRFLSDPDLPEDEVLARLLFGRGIDTLSPLQAAQLASAVATLAGQGGEGIVSRLRRNFGLDDLDVTTDDDGNVAVRAGAYLSDNVYTDVTVGGAGEAEVNLNLDLTPSITVKGGVDSEGETGLGVFFERDY